MATTQLAIWTTHTYDANDRLASDTYDANGNTTGSGGNVYRYDFENRIIALNPGRPSEVTFLYDGDGNRVAKTVGSGASAVTTKFLVDTNNPTGYAQVVEELTSPVGGPPSSVAVSRVYVHGHSLISEQQLLGSPTPVWTTSFYGMDGHGSVRFLTDSNGAITDTYTFDAFGTLISSTGSTPNNYLYAGEELDQNLGFYYLRARYLNASTGRFWTTDEWEGTLYDPVSLHRYLYAAADPMNKVDPSGRFTLTQAVITAAIVGVLAGIAVPLIRGVGDVSEDASFTERFTSCFHHNGGSIAIVALAIALGIDLGGEPLPKTPEELRYLGERGRVSDLTTRLSRFNRALNEWLQANVGRGLSKLRAFRVSGRILSAIRPVTNVLGAFLGGYIVGLIPGCAIAAGNRE